MKDLKGEIESRFNAAGLEYTAYDRDRIATFFRGIRKAATEPQRRAETLAFVEGRIEGLVSAKRAREHATRQKILAHQSGTQNQGGDVGPDDGPREVGLFLGF